MTSGRCPSSHHSVLPYLLVSIGTFWPLILTKVLIHFLKLFFLFLDQDFDVRAVSPAGCHLSPEHIIPGTLSGTAASVTGPVEQLGHLGQLEHLEQSVTIIPNLR